jgi:hypothetical protein
VYVFGDSETDCISVIAVYFGSEMTKRLGTPHLPYTSRILLHLCDHLSQFVGRGGLH